MYIPTNHFIIYFQSSILGTYLPGLRSYCASMVLIHFTAAVHYLSMLSANLFKRRHKIGAGPTRRKSEINFAFNMLIRLYRESTCNNSKLMDFLNVYSQAIYSVQLIR